MTKTMYAVIRQDKYDGHKWLDPSTLSTIAQIAKSKADSMDKEMPVWAGLNIQVKVTELTVTYDE